MGASLPLPVRPNDVALPNLLPKPVLTYLAHTEAGTSIRALARRAGVHPSTVLRQVRRTEQLREDPLTDAALDRLGRSWKTATALGPDMVNNKETLPMAPLTEEDPRLERECLRVLRALLETDTLLVIADGVDDAVVVHNSGDGNPVRRAVLTRDVAEMLALNEFITGQITGRLSRYTITPAGRAEVRRRLAQNESHRAALRGQAEDADSVDAGGDFFAPDTVRRRRRRSVGAEAPLAVLARRKRSSGANWLSPELVATGHRFRESWELAQVDGAIATDWDRLVAGRVSSSARGGDTRATRRLDAETRLSAAIQALGPDLAETLILAVCKEQGMEDIEARLDYPARSGKIVLRIALNTLKRHYAETCSTADDLIY